MKKKLSYGIIGLGRFGTSLAYELSSMGAEILVLDKDEEKIQSIREITEHSLIVKSLDKKTLLETGIQNCDAAIICIGEEADTSILAAMNLINIGVPRVIAKVTSLEHGEVLEYLGAEVVYPERDMAIRLANRLEASTVIDIVKLSEKINFTKFIAPKAYINKTVLDINVRKQFGLNIIAIESNGTVINSITPDYQIKENDLIFLTGSKKGLMKLSLWLEKQEK
ncbi:MAG: TrkA family potassium uptake protein [Acholeplasmatales bacterium]|nr:TrkA family potassium uptake protein [Acholeplasmatales bacterium]